MAVAPDAANMAFWDELCGTAHARALGVVDASAPSLKRFDDWYFAFYPYLLHHVRPEACVGKRVLEVGLGYGTLAQRLAERGAIYQGLDIAAGPVAMVNHRLAQAGRLGAARQGSILQCPFAGASFDRVVAIGCFHHTGDLARALAETHRVLAPGGSACIMVYNAYSYRRWLRWPFATLRYFAWDKLGLGRRGAAAADERAAYDIDSSGAAAPETVFVSAGELRRLAAHWSHVEVRRENIGGELILSRIDRGLLLRWCGPWAGLDLYAELRR